MQFPTNQIKKFLTSLFTREQYAGVIDSIFLLGGKIEIAGWACDLKRKDRKLQVEIHHGADLLAITDCNLFRIDLKELGYGNGYNGFHAIVDTGKHAHDINNKVSVKIQDSAFYLQDKHASTNQDKLLSDKSAPPFYVCINSANQELVSGAIKYAKGQTPADSVQLVTRTGKAVGYCAVSGDKFSIIPAMAGDEEQISDLYLLDSHCNPLLSHPVFLERESRGKGLVTGIEANQISGWAHLLTTRYHPATVLAFVDDELVGYAKATNFRQDVLSPFSNLGFCGFRLSTVRSLTAEDLSSLHIKISGTVNTVEIPENILGAAMMSARERDRTVETTPRFVGYLDQCSTQFMPGWAVNMAAPEMPANVDIFVDEWHLTTLTPDVYRKDVNEKYSLKGNVGFNFEFPAGLSLSGEVNVSAKFHDSGEELYNCPRKIIFGLPGVNLFSPPSQIYEQISVFKPPYNLDSPEPSLAIIVLNRNGGPHLDTLFSSFHSLNTYNNYKFYIVDHLSRDDSETICAEWKTKLNIDFIKRGRNFSFSASNNFAAKFATEEILLFLNNDIRFTSDILPRSVAFFQDPDTGIVGIKLLNDLGAGIDNNPVQHLGVRFDFSRPHRTFLPYEIMDLKMDSPLFATVYSPPAVTAAFMLTRRNDFQAVNGFDEGYFYGFEDVDFCLTFANRMKKRIICATELGALHKTSATRRQLAGKERKRVSANFKRLNERVGKYLTHTFRNERCKGVSNLTGKRFALAFAVSGTSLDIPEGDFYTAYELGAELTKQYGWEIRFLTPDVWYRLRGFDAVVAMRHDFNPRLIAEQGPYLIKIAWLRNWFESWIASDYVRDFDLIWCASAKAAEILRERTGAVVRTLYIATNHNTFTPGPESSDYKSDYSFTGSFYLSPRQICFDLDPDTLPYNFALFGSNWENIPNFDQYRRGHIPYTKMPAVYRSTKLVLDDVNHTVKGWGSVNSRVFDALAAGTLVLTNDSAASEELFDGLLPFYSSKQDLREKLCAYIEDETSRRNLAGTLRKTILENHTYELRARQVYNAIHEYDATMIRIGIVTHPEMIHAGMIARHLQEVLCAKGFVVHWRTPGKHDRNQSLGDDAIIFISDHHANTVLPYQPEAHQYNLLLFNGSLDQLPLGTIQILDEIVLLNAGDHEPEPTDEVTSIHYLEGQAPQYLHWRKTDSNSMVSDAGLLLDTSLFCKKLMAFSDGHFALLKERITAAHELNNSSDEMTLRNNGRIFAASEDELVYLKYFTDNLQLPENRKSLYKDFPYYYDINPGTIDAALNILKQTDNKAIFHLLGISGIIGSDNACKEVILNRIKSFLKTLDDFLELKGLFIWSVHDCSKYDEATTSLDKELFQALFNRAHIVPVFSADARDELKLRFKVKNDVFLAVEPDLNTINAACATSRSSSALIERIKEALNKSHE